MVLCHIRRMSTNQMNTYTLQLANVGDVEAVLCRRGDAVLLTQKFSTSVNRDECERIYKADGIITEVIHDEKLYLARFSILDFM